MSFLASGESVCSASRHLLTWLVILSFCGFCRQSLSLCGPRWGGGGDSVPYVMRISPSLGPLCDMACPTVAHTHTHTHTHTHNCIHLSILWPMCLLCATPAALVCVGVGELGGGSVFVLHSVCLCGCFFRFDPSPCCCLFCLDDVCVTSLT